jgi:aryl-alcohol dehydrogenase-like predicted oxidoreductase
LLRFKELGLVRRVGVSVYDPATLTTIVNRFPIEMVQLPLNVLDQRFWRNGSIAELARKNIEVHARSVFLQGTLLADAAQLPALPTKAGNAISKFHRRAEAGGFSPLVAALSYVIGCAGVDRILIGVDSLKQLQSILMAFEQAEGHSFDGAGLDVEDSAIIDPRQWEPLSSRR